MHPHLRVENFHSSESIRNVQGHIAIEMQSAMSIMTLRPSIDSH